MRNAVRMKYAMRSYVSRFGLAAGAVAAAIMLVAGAPLPAMAQPRAAASISASQRATPDTVKPSAASRAPLATFARRDPLVRVSAHVHVGRLSQTARDSFTAILGRASGIVFGGGVEAALRNGLFVRGDVSRFAGDGERVIIENGQPVSLGIPLTLTLTPIELTGGYRWRPIRLGQRGALRLAPYVAGGAGVVRYRESSDDDHPEELVEASFTSYHMLAGVDVPIGSRVTGGVEYQRRWVPGGLGEGGVSLAYGETDLGGGTLRMLVRVVF